MVSRTKVWAYIAGTFAGFWLLSVHCWLGIFHAAPIIVLWAPITPAYGTVYFLAKGNLGMGFVCLLVSGLAIVLCARAVAKRRGIIAACGAIVLYWFWSFCIIGTGV
jgi:hypothetical protein